MLGSATLVMKKSMIGRNAPASRMNTPTGCSPPARAVARGEVAPGLPREEMVVVMTTPKKLCTNNYEA